MANCFLQKTFHFETECQRRDAPKEDVGAWLESQSLEQAKVETGFEWRVDRTHLEKQDDGTHFYTVTMRCLSNAVMSQPAKGEALESPTDYGLAR